MGIWQYTALPFRCFGEGTDFLLAMSMQFTMTKRACKGNKKISFLHFLFVWYA